MTNHETYMLRCLQLATGGLGNVAPNPMVGCIVVHRDKIIGEGFHQAFGEAHAEVNAINSVKDKSLLKEATIYINLEPCSHFGKTPPCSDLIIRHKIKEVVISCYDPFPQVSGNGIKRLKDSGSNVITGILEQEGRELNRRFFTFHEKQRPFIILKWAQTLDRFTDKKREKGEASSTNDNWISNERSKMLVHKWRSEEQGIMVGTNTALNDNPQLNVREWEGNSPTRIVLDEALQLPPDLHLFDKTIPTLVFTQKKKESTENLSYVTIDFSLNVVSQILHHLYERKIQSIIVEGGSHLLNTFIEFNLWDEARVIIGNKTFGAGLQAPAIEKEPFSIDEIGNNKLLIYKNY